MVEAIMFVVTRRYLERSECEIPLDHATWLRKTCLNRRKHMQENNTQNPKPLTKHNSNATRSRLQLCAHTASNPINNSTINPGPTCVFHYVMPYAVLATGVADPIDLFVYFHIPPFPPPPVP